MYYLLSHHVNMLCMAMVVISLAVVFVFVTQVFKLTLAYITHSVEHVEQLCNSAIYYTRKVFILPWIISWRLVLIIMQVILGVCSIILQYLVTYGTRVLLLNPLTLWKIQQYGTPFFMEQAPWMVKWVRNVYGGYLNWVYPHKYELYTTMYALVFMFSYLCRWLGYFVYLTYYYAIYLLRRCLIMLCTPYVVEMVFFCIYYMYHRISYYMNVIVYTLSWAIYVAIRIQSYYLLPSLAIYYLRRFFNRNWQEWYFAENTQGDGHTPEFIYMDNPSPAMIKLFKQVRPVALDANIGGLGYVWLGMQMIVLSMWVICILVPMYTCYKVLELMSKFLLHVNYNHITYYYGCINKIYDIWEWMFNYESNIGVAHYVSKVCHWFIIKGVYLYQALPALVVTMVHMMVAWLFYTVYMCIWLLYYTPSYIVVGATKGVQMLLAYRVPLLLLCVCYWGNYTYISQLIYIGCDITANVWSHTVSTMANVPLHIPLSFSGYDAIAHVAPQISVGTAGYPSVTQSLALMERMPVTPYVMGYHRYYQLYDVCYIHPRMKYWYSPVVWRWWDEVYYYYTDYIYAWINLDPRSKWMHLSVRLNTSVWKPYQITKSWHSLSGWGVNMVPVSIVEGSLFTSNVLITTPSQEQALWESEQPWSRIVHWPYGITRLDVGGYVDYHVGGRYLTGAWNDYYDYSYVDIYRDGTADKYELWLIKQWQKAMVESNLKLGWPFFNQLTASPALSRVDLLHDKGVQLQLITYASNYPHLGTTWFKELVAWKWSFIDNMPDILRRRDKYTWLHHLNTLTGSWDLYKVQLYMKWLRPLHGTLYGVQDWFARGFTHLVWEVVNSRWMFWWQYCHQNFTLKLGVIISFANHVFIIYPYTWMNFLWHIINSKYTTFDIMYAYLMVVIHYIVYLLSQSYNYTQGLDVAGLYTLWHSAKVYVCMDMMVEPWRYHIACYTWYTRIVVTGYIHLLLTSMDAMLHFFQHQQPTWGYYITASTHYDHFRIARYLDELNSRQHLQDVLDWIYIQHKVAKVTQIVMQDWVETDNGELEHTVITLEVNTPPINPWPLLQVVNVEQETQPLILQEPMKVQLPTHGWLQEVMALMCQHKGYMLWLGYLYTHLQHYIQFTYHVCVKLSHFTGYNTGAPVLGWTPRYSITNIFYVPIIVFTKLQYWIDSWCVELQLPRRMQKYNVIYEYRRAGGHVKGHSQDLTYLRISPVRRSFLFSTYKWKPHNFMDYLHYVNSVQYTDPWWRGVTPYNGLKVGVGSQVTQGQYTFPTTAMFTYASNYVIRPLAVCTILMYYITLITLIVCSSNLQVLLTCKQPAASCNRQYAWDRFRTQPSSHYDWMHIPPHKAKYLQAYMHLTPAVNISQQLFVTTLINNQIVTNNHLVQPLLVNLYHHSLHNDTSYINPSVYALMSDHKYTLICNNLILPTDEFIKGIAFGYSKDTWINKVNGKEEEQDYVEWDQAFTYNSEYAKLHVHANNALYATMFFYDKVHGNLPPWAWHKDAYNLRIFERSIEEDLTATTSYVYEERVSDTPYIPWGSLAWGCIIPIVLFAKPLVFMGKWWHHSNRPAHMLTQQFNFYMEEVLHHLNLMDYMALFTPRDMVNGKIGGYAHGAKPDMKRVILLDYEGVYGSNFYTNYTGGEPIWLSEGKLLTTSVLGISHSSLEELRLAYLFNMLCVLMMVWFIFKKVRVQPTNRVIHVSSVKYSHISHYMWVKKQAQRFFTWFWR